MLDLIMWLFLGLFIIVAFVIAILSIIICIGAKKLNEERERRYANDKKNPTDGRTP